MLQFIYVSVTAKTDSASFTIKGATCDPAICVEGTSGATVFQVSMIVIFTAMIMITADNIWAFAKLYK